MKFRILTLCLVIIFFQSCNNDDDNPVLQGEFDGGYFLLNEGAFGTGAGTVSYLDNNLSGIQNQVYSNVNSGEQLGNILQSATYNEDKIYFVVNNSHRIVVANRYTLEKLSVIETDLNNPRYMAISNGKGYVSNWGEGSSSTDDYIAVINLSDNTVEQNISVAEGPEKIVERNGKIYVLHQGGWSQNNKVSVINTTTNTVEQTITVGDVPNSFILNNTSLYVLCGGKPSWTGAETEASLYKINTNDNIAVEVSNLSSFTTSMEHASHLNLYSNNLYFTLNGAIHKLPIDENVTNATSFIAENFYDFFVIDGKFVGLDAGNYTSEGTMKVYNTTGEEINMFTTGIIPTFLLKN